jgi:hypothetical protein
VIVILCEASDDSALWAAGALRARGLAPVVLNDLDLAAVQTWRHTVGATGAHSELRLPNGTQLRGGEVRGALNRLTFLPRALLSRIGGPDREYAIQEMYALYLSWLHSICGRKLNPPAPQGLCGNGRHPSAWTALAYRAGLPVKPFRQSSQDDPTAFWRRSAEHETQSVVVLGQSVFGPESIVDSHREGCLRLARDSGCPLLGIEFEAGYDGSWRVCGATVMPDLRPGAEALADALAEELS